jgi:hypothetical protein
MVGPILFWAACPSSLRLRFSGQQSLAFLVSGARRAAYLRSLRLTPFSNKKTADEKIHLP